MGKLFGTDGVRGIANQDLTGDLAYRLGRAAAYVLLKDRPGGKVLIGKDTRQSGDMLEAAIGAGFMSMGVEVVSLGVIPTPAVAYLTRALQADCGVVISASHNPAAYNGIKFFNHQGFKLPDETEEAIEAYLNQDQELPYPSAGAIGGFTKEEQAKAQYGDYLAATVKGRFQGLRIALDVGNGAAYQLAPELFRRLGAEVVVINDKPDGNNINLGCGSTHPEKLQELVRQTGAHAGITFDGDADRALAVDEKGELVDGDYILAICGSRLKKQGSLKQETVVATVMSNIGLDIAMKERGISLAKTKVGDRYVLEEMLQKGYSLGGEQSGHVIFLEYNTTGDGLLTALQLIDTMVEDGKALSELKSMMTTYPQVLVNARVSKEKKHAYLNDRTIQDEIQRIEARLDGQGRVLIRPSGTESLVRVMLEGKNQEELNHLAAGLAHLIENQFSQ